MGDKDLEKVLKNISKSERKDAIKQAQIDRLRELVEKQKNVISDLEGIIGEQKRRIDSMFDVPADIEQLKKMIGNQRAQLNDKDQNLELAYSRIAELEQELKGQVQTQAILNKKFESTFAQIGEIKADLAEKNALVGIKDNEIQNLNIKVTEFQKFSDENKKEISRLNELIRNKDIELIGAQSSVETKSNKEIFAEREETIEKYRNIINENKEENSKLKDLLRKKDLRKLIEAQNKVETELKEQIFAERDETFKKIQDLETKILETELSTKEKIAKAENSINAYDDMKKKYEELIKKYNEFSELDKKAKEEIESFRKEMQDLRSFKEENEKVITIFEKLRKLMEEEPMFRIFGMIWDVGEISMSDLKNAIGITTITLKKYINNYEKYGILSMNDSGKISLVDK